MTVVYTCDDNFVWIMGISMISLFENNKDMKDLDVYLLGDHVSEDNKNVLSGIAKGYGRDVLEVVKRADEEMYKNKVKSKAGR